MLELLGLSADALTVYRAMLAHPGHGVGALGVVTGMDVRRIRSALDELADLALLRPSGEQTGQLRPVSPEVGLAALLAEAEAETARRQAQIEATRAAIAAIAAEHAGTRDRDAAIRLEGVDAVRARLEELAPTLTAECCSLNPGGMHAPDARAAGTPLNQQLLERGVAIRAVCQDSFRNDQATLAHARWLTELGGQMRTVPVVPIPLLLLDRRIAILPIDPADPRAGALETHSPGMTAAAHALFALAWSSGTPFGQAPNADDQGRSPTDRALLEIAAAGHTDEAAARKLGVSLRTVRRQMSDLMTRLDATSRFQAGVNAVRKGWL
ncbi:helix-turn-helix transcriptional regulator [Longispora albida]|uniref:helix-turn-helix transcriptional regulator n=1 Tax=Longispora albida TaxID=203523 RepID=UPI000378F364|nr:helix-turn-helix transcriptional regulator [Longispora albida]